VGDSGGVRNVLTILTNTTGRSDLYLVGHCAIIAIAYQFVEGPSLFATSAAAAGAGARLIRSLLARRPQRTLAQRAQ
jgi:hypothetical protein